MNKYQIRVTKPDNPHIYIWLNILDNKIREINENIRINPEYTDKSSDQVKKVKQIEEVKHIEKSNLLNLNFDTLSCIEKFLKLENLGIFRRTCYTIYNTTSLFNKIDLSVFNDRQRNAVKNIVLNISRENTNYISFTGGAGTGKSFTIIEMFKLFKTLFLKKKIAFVGPTNIIVNKFKENHENIKEYFKVIKYLTVSGLLNEKPIFDSDGNKIFKQKNQKIDGLSTKNKKTKLWDTNFDVVIFDESSMIENDKLEKILDIINKKKLKTLCIFVGDKNQLNPVNENENFILEKPSINLLKNMRCSIDSLNDIYNLIIDEIYNYNNSYNYLNLDNFINKIKYKLINNTENIKVFNDKNEFIKHFISKYKTENSIVSTYTNKECDNLNENIKNVIVEQNGLTLVDKYYTGQQIIFTEPYIIKPGNIVYNTSEIAQIINISKKHIYLNKIDLNNFKLLLASNKDDIIKTYHILTNNFNNLNTNLNKIFEEFNQVLKFKGLIININNNKNNLQNIEVINSKEQNKLDERIKKIENEIDLLKKKYKKEKSLDLDSKQKHKLLNEYIINNLYELLSNWLSKFAKISDGYALTVHKSQGITIKNIYVNLVDIMTMTDNKNKLKCIYTAFTRCTDNLIVYLLDNPVCKCNKYSNKYYKNNDIYWKCDKCKYFKWDNNNNFINNELKII